MLPLTRHTHDTDRPTDVGVFRRQTSHLAPGALYGVVYECMRRHGLPYGMYSATVCPLHGIGGIQSRFLGPTGYVACACERGAGG